MKLGYDNTKFILDNLDDIDKYTSTILFKAGQIIFYKDHEPYGLYILKDGTVEINYKKYSEKINPVTAFGVNSFVQNTIYKGTAKAIKPCTISFLSRTKYKELIEEKLKTK
ncbi:MAG: cyclic nucleotide-binding domain-containing protein [Candidatus Sericytochromatia bacterium]